MTINEYLQSLKKLHNEDGKSLEERMKDITEVWSDEACKGFCILAMRKAGLDAELEAVLDALDAILFDCLPAEAENTFYKFINF